MYSILVVGDATIATGFSRLILSIFSRLAQKYELHQLALGYTGDPHDYHWPLYPAHSRGDPYGRNRLAEIVMKIQPSLIFLVNDIWLVASYLDVISDRKFAGTPVVAYCPIEGRGFNPDIVLKLQRLSKLVLYTEFGRREIERCFAMVDQDVDANNFIDVIPHGIDLSTFYPMNLGSSVAGSAQESKRRAKEMLLKEEVSSDAFYVLNANRNQPRKRIDLTFQAFSIFCRDKPADVKLYLHMGLEDLGWDIGQLARRFEVSDRLILTTDLPTLPHVPDDQLNLIYNACDVGVSTAAAEGWGLVAFEHGATYAPQVLPRSSSYAELWNDAALFVDPVMTIISPDLMFDHELIAPKDVAQALEMLYQDNSTYNKLAEAAYRNACRPELSWDTIAKRWDRLFESLLC